MQLDAGILGEIIKSTALLNNFGGVRLLLCIR